MDEIAHADTKFRLCCKVGTSLDPTTFQPLTINDDLSPVYVNSENFEGYIMVRAKDLGKDHPPDDVHPPPVESAWFATPEVKHNRAINSIQITGRFKRDGAWTGDQVVFGNQFDRALKLPLLFSTAIRFAKYIDPSLEIDLDAKHPWAFSPLLSTMNIVNVKPIASPPAETATATQPQPNDVSAPSPQPPAPLSNDAHTTIEDSAPAQASVPSSSSSPSLLLPWNSPHGEFIPEDNALIIAPNGLDSAARRVYFAKDKEHLHKHIFQSDHVYTLNFFNSQINFGQLRIDLPGGFSFSVEKYWDGQPLRYVCKSKDDSAIFFVIQLELIPVEEVEIE